MTSPATTDNSTNNNTDTTETSHDDVTNLQEAEEAHDDDVNTSSEEESDADEDDDVPGVPSADGSPVFIKRSRDFQAFDGDSARFDCVISGDPDPDVRWLKDGQPIVVNRRKFAMESDDDGRRSLVIKYCDVDDSATYTCRLTNDHGQALCEAKLLIRPMK